VNGWGAFPAEQDPALPERIEIRLGFQMTVVSFHFSKVSLAEITLLTSLAYFDIVRRYAKT